MKFRTCIPLALVAAVAFAAGLAYGQTSVQPANPSKTAPTSSVTAKDSGFNPYQKLNASHILIMHKDSMRAPANVKRTKEEALARAKEVAAKLQAKGADFAALAKAYSDCPSGQQSKGSLGDFRARDMDPAFSKATAKLKIGQTSDVVESKFGYHIIRRDPLDPVLHAAHILIPYKGAMAARPDVARTKEQARATAQEILNRYKKGEKFEDLAKKNSSCPSAEDGGVLPQMPIGRLHPDFEKAALKCKVGEVTDIVETPFGFHIIKRVEPEPTILAKHILIMHNDSMRKPENIKRTKADALALAKDILKKIKNGEKFGMLAMKYSDCPSKARGGELREFSKGTMHPDFEKAALECKPGQVTGIVETPFGYHIIYRVD
jgi:peptidyl-prolyl cis-trans isomerase SurA